jgi:hypothetical protein
MLHALPSIYCKESHKISSQKLRSDRLYREGWQLREIMAVTGHASLASLTRYLELDREKAALALAEMDE